MNSEFTWIPPAGRFLGVAETVEGQSTGVETVEGQSAGVAPRGTLGWVQDDSSIDLAEIRRAVLGYVGVTVAHTGPSTHHPGQRISQIFRLIKSLFQVEQNSTEEWKHDTSVMSSSH